MVHVWTVADGKVATFQQHVDTYADTYMVR
jgi:ketosteroid isomerase-like protein